MIILPSPELMPMIHAALERGQRVSLAVRGSSMLPFIGDGDVVEMEKVRSPLMLGDILLVQCPEERFVLHRVIRIEGDAFFLRGDAQGHCEGPFTREDVLGKVIICKRRGRERQLDRGVWRIAGLVWIHCTPLGLWLLPLGIRIGGFVGRFFRFCWNTRN